MFTAQSSTYMDVLGRKANFGFDNFLTFTLYTTLSLIGVGKRERATPLLCEMGNIMGGWERCVLLLSLSKEEVRYIHTHP